MEWLLAISNEGVSMRAAIAGFVRKQLYENSNKVNIWHIIFDSNGTTYVETYAIPTKWLKLTSRTKLHTPVPTDNHWSSLIWLLKAPYDATISWKNQEVIENQHVVAC